MELTREAPRARRGVRSLGFGLLGSWLLVGCQAETEKTTATPAALPRPALRPAAPASSARRAAKPPFAGYHRYRGMVGRQPVTVELTFDPTNADLTKRTCAGYYYYGRGSRGLLRLWAAPYQPRQPLQLRETADDDETKNTGSWQADQPAGSLLTGRWTSPGGQQWPFTLHEDYQDGQQRQMAVRYEVVQDAAHGPRCDSELRKLYPRAELTQEVLHLLGADTLHPALRRLQCPVPARRRAAMRAFLRDEGRCQETANDLGTPTLNDFGLLSLTTASTGLDYTAGRYNHTLTSATYDLRTGQEVTFAQLLRPGADTLLQKLIAYHLSHDPPVDGEIGANAYAPGELAPLPDGVCLNYYGLSCAYGDTSLGGPGYTSTELAYDELLPLLRADSPVARMLRERGLWHPAKPR